MIYFVQNGNSDQKLILQRLGILFDFHSRYRTDSETTDEQCIPESISEAHDSAIDSTEDIVEEEAIESDIEMELDDMETDKGQSIPPLTLEVQSSTESDKTVLSLKHNNTKDDLNNSVPNSPGLMSLCSNHSR